MLMRTDPFRDSFRDLDRMAQLALGTAGTLARPSAMPMDAWRDGDTFRVELDLPGVDPSSIDLDVERNVVTVKAERPTRASDAGPHRRRATEGGVQPAARPGRQSRHGTHPGQLRLRRALAVDPGGGEGQAPNLRRRGLARGRAEASRLVLQPQGRSPRGAPGAADEARLRGPRGVRRREGALVGAGPRAHGPTTRSTRRRPTVRSPVFVLDPIEETGPD